MLTCCIDLIHWQHLYFPWAFIPFVLSYYSNFPFPCGFFHCHLSIPLFSLSDFRTLEMNAWPSSTLLTVSLRFAISKLFCIFKLFCSTLISFVSIFWCYFLFFVVVLLGCHFSFSQLFLGVLVFCFRIFYVVVVCIRVFNNHCYKLMENIRIQFSIFLRHDGTSVRRHVSIQNLWKMQFFLIMYDLLVDTRHLWQKKSTSLMKFA